MKLALKMVPHGLQERARPAVERAQRLIRDFEWTWTKAVVASLVLWLIALTATSVIPSWWLYFAENNLGWRNTRICDVWWFPEQCGFWLFKLRDLVAVILFSGPFVTLILASYHIQKLRRKLRSEPETRPTGGYR